jgi:ABC-2 type transport system ATP-binding protein
LETVIRAEHLGRRFGDVVAVEDVSFEVQKGEVFGFLGPNGAGKTTTVRMLCALIEPSDGQAWVAGAKLGQQDQMVRRNVGILTETPGLYDRLSGRQNLELFGRIHRIEKLQKRVQHYLELLGLWERREDLAGTYSKGMRQKLAIARALLHDPPLLFLDEPTSALDPASAKVVRDAIEELSGQGRTIFLCTHNLSEAERLCDRLAFLRRRLLSVDTLENLRAGCGPSVVRLRIAADDAAAKTALDVASEMPFVRSAALDEGSSGDGECALRIELAESAQGDAEGQHNPELLAALLQAGLAIRWVEQDRHSLEALYLDLVEKEQG